MGPLGFTEDTKNAAEVAFCYGKLRQAELQRSYWKFAIKRTVLRPLDSTFMKLAPALWSSTATYFNGSIVSDSQGSWWVSKQPGNVNNAPGGSSYWDLYFGPVAIPPWDTTGGTVYSSGEVVFTSAGVGSYAVYLSLIDNNTDNPGTVTAYDPTVTYSQDAIVTFNSVQYQSLVDLNLNNEPDTNSAALWSSATTYALNATVRGSDGLKYTSLVNSNTNNNPVFDGGINWSTTGALVPWTTTISRAASSNNWLVLGCGLQEMKILWPAGSGPTWQSSTRNIFRLPANFLRPAPQLPKTGVPILGGPSGLGYDDWEYDGHFIVTWTSTTIVYRFVADITDVQSMHGMFCEGLSCRLALEVCETLTQSAAKKQGIASEYQKFMGEARLVDAIEEGPTSVPDDDWVTVRL